MDPTNRGGSNHTDAQRLRRNQHARTEYAARKSAILEERRLARSQNKNLSNEARRKEHHARKTSINCNRRIAYAVNSADINSRRRSRQAAQRQARGSVLAEGRDRWETAVFCTDRRGCEVSNFQDALARRQQALDTARDSAGVALKTANPRQHCGVKLFAKETEGMCCEHGKGILPRLPALPPLMAEMYSSAEDWVIKFLARTRGRTILSFQLRFA